jgi:hypothetical protein
VLLLHLSRTTELGYVDRFPAGVVRPRSLRADELGEWRQGEDQVVEEPVTGIGHAVWTRDSGRNGSCVDNNCR